MLLNREEKSSLEQVHVTGFFFRFYIYNFIFLSSGHFINKCFVFLPFAILPLKIEILLLIKYYII